MTLLASGQFRALLAGTWSASSSGGKLHMGDARVPGHGQGFGASGQNGASLLKKTKTGICA